MTGAGKQSGGSLGSTHKLLPSARRIAWSECLPSAESGLKTVRHSNDTIGLTLPINGHDYRS
ncbi:MAG: hypothetical protein GC196_01425 [Hyphomonas sp.]|nr:hypothetical protein [Hyphomonas sp.]